MSLLRDIQESIVAPSSDLAPILLKLRFLANRLGSGQIEEWVLRESEGYPANVDVPEYRIVGVSYNGSFQNAAYNIQNTPIPPYIVKKYCGENWTNWKMRESISTIDSLIKKSGKTDTLAIDASNLILLLQGKVYQGFNCYNVKGTISSSSVLEIQNSVRTRMLELTLNIEKEIPNSHEITIRNNITPEVEKMDKSEKIFHTTIYGDNNIISASGNSKNILINNKKHDINGLVNELITHGIPEQAAKQFAELVASEEPTSAKIPFGKKAQKWLSDNIPTITQGAWDVSLTVATSVLEAAIKRFYGLE